MVGKWGSRPVKPIGRNVVMEAQPMELHGAEESALCERCLGQRLHNGQRQTGPRLTRLTQTHGGTDKDKDKEKQIQEIVDNNA